MGEWYAGIYEIKKCPKLFIGGLRKQFLDDKNEKVKAIVMRCLKPKMETGAILEDTPDHLPYIEMFKVFDVIAGTLELTPLKGKNRYP